MSRIRLAGAVLMAGSIGCSPGGGDTTGSGGASMAATTGDTGVDPTGATTVASTSLPTTGGTEVVTGGSDPTSTTADVTTTSDVTTTGTTEAGSATGGSTGPGSTGPGPDLPPVQKVCSADLKAVLDEQGLVLETCPSDQGCADGACVPACTAAAVSQANFGCDFIVPTPPSYPPALPPCFAVFLANVPPPPRRSPPHPPKSRYPRQIGRSARIRHCPVTDRSGPKFPKFWQRFGNAPSAHLH